MSDFDLANLDLQRIGELFQGKQLEKALKEKIQCGGVDIERCRAYYERLLEKKKKGTV